MAPPPACSSALMMMACRPIYQAASGVLGPLLARRWSSAATSTSASPSTASGGGGGGGTGGGSLLLADISLDGHRASMLFGPLLVGFFNYFERHVPQVGFFEPISGRALRSSELGGRVDRHVELLYRVFKMAGDPQRMSGVDDSEAAKLIASGRTSELLDRVYGAYQSYREGRDVVLVEGPGPLIGGTELDAQIAATLASPVLMAMAGHPTATANDYYNQAMVKRQLFAEHRVDVLGVVVNGLPRAHHALLAAQLSEKFERGGLAFAGAIPEDAVLASVRLDEVRTLLGAELLYGDALATDVEYDDVVVASQRLEELLEILEERPGGKPLIVTSADRLDIVLGLLAAQLSLHGPRVAGVVLTQAGAQRAARKYARATVDKIFGGIRASGQYAGSLMPVLCTETPLAEALVAIGRADAAILPTSQRKITQCKALFERHVDANAVVAGLQRSGAGRPAGRVTPKMFTHGLKAKCRADPQHVVLPEALDPRVLAAAADVTQRGLARVTLLGDPAAVASEAAKLGLDVSGCRVHHPAASDLLERYVDLLVAARAKKGMTRAAAADLLNGDVNFYGTLMVAAGDADGMVSGAIHTTASTIRPALQVLKTPDSPLVSSVFFMCLPDRVLVYGDCAVNVNPTAPELASIAITSADTAAAFGIEPRVAMLSYSTLGSGAGPDVQKVVEAVALVKQRRPDIKVEGPIQYDAAIDPAVAKVKVKGASEVAGRASVFIFPDLNTGNNTYKAVQQASGAIAMGPVMQGLLKPVNDLSRGCTVPDIVNTICVTSIQAMQFKQRQAAAATATATAAAATA